MTYETAKKMEEKGYEFVCIEQTEYRQSVKDTDFREPTLSELIEACGHRLTSMRKGSWKGKGKWMASGDSIDALGNSFPVEPVGTGESLEEAVADLWLLLPSLYPLPPTPTL